jgi:hypothetical protein
VKCGSGDGLCGTSFLNSHRKHSAQIMCPLFIVAGGQDRWCRCRMPIVLPAKPRRPVDLLCIEDGNHIDNNRPYKWRLRTADWMAAKLSTESGPGLR